MADVLAELTVELKRRNDHQLGPERDRDGLEHE
jgi:hypothetical protein